MDKTPEMVERVARVLATANSDRDWRAWIVDARAVIQAMREPTDAMADAGRWPGEDGEPMEAWRAMIDAALASPEEGKADSKESLRTALLAVPDEGEGP